MRQASRCLSMGLLMAAAAWAGDAAAATNTLKGMSYDTLPGGRVEVHLNFAGGPPPQPRIFTTGNPPRIAVDFADTTNAAQRHIDVGQGSTSGVSAVSAGGRTRVVVELMRDSSYLTRVDGNDLVLTVNNGSGAQTTTTAATIDPTKALPSAMNGPSVSGIDFRRGPHGEGRVLVSFSGDGANVDMHREGGKLIVNLDHVTLPANQAQHLDVLDFATPVQAITTRAGAGGGARMEIDFKGNVETSSYQTADQYVVEVAPKNGQAANGSLAKGAPPVYSGTRVTFNFQDIPVRSVLQLLADYSGQNLVASDSVQGNITLRLSNVPWDQVLDVILRAKGLDKRRDGNVIWIAPQQELAAYEQNVAEARLKAEDTAELTTDYVPISYGKAKDIAKLLTTGSMQSGTGSGGQGAAGASMNRGFLSTRGSVSYDERTNTLLLNDTPGKIQELRELIARLDKPVQQVLIESRIVIATDDFTRELGVKWGVQGYQTTSGGHVFTTSPTAGDAATIGIDHSNNLNGSGDGTITYQTGDAGGFNVNLPTTIQGGSLGLAILGANYLVDLELQAAQTEGRGEVISSPRVITANQQEAVIRQGQEIGYVTYQNSATGSAGSGTATVQFKDAVLELRVTPTITADNRVFLKINVKKDALAGYVDAPGSGKIPTIDTREVNTSALVSNGQTVVLGGIYEINKSNSVTKVPGLGDIPGIGALFRKTSRTNNKAELLIFVTPRILSENLQ